MSLEQRRFTRLFIKSMGVKCKMHLDAGVELINVSLNGACISSRKPLKMGSEYELHFESGENIFSIKGVVIWSSLRQNAKKGVPKSRVYEVGIRFNNILTDKGVSLINFMDQGIYMKRVKKRLGEVRVKIVRSKTSTVLSDFRNFTIVKISLGGMLIETGQKVKVEKRFSMELNLPGSKQPLKFIGRIASCVEMPDTVPRRYGTGIEFIHMNEKDRERLNKFVDSITAAK